jgi:hypothetical protein
MAKLIGLKIDVTKITKDKLFKGEKGTYLDLTISLNDEKDKFGNDVSCWEKCEKEETKNYLGNGKVFWSNDEKPKPKPEDYKPLETPPINDGDELPF